MLYFYTRFKAQNPQMEIEFTAFHKFKPLFIHKLKDSTLDVANNIKK